MKVIMPNEYIIIVEGKTYPIKDKLKGLGFWFENGRWIINGDNGIRSSKIPQEIIKSVETITNKKVIRK